MKISFSKLTTTTLATLAQRVINSSKNGNYTVVKNHPLLLEVEKEYEIYDKVYAKLTFSGKGKEVAEVDNLRDSLFSSLKFLVRGYSKAVTLPEHILAKELLGIINELGKNMMTLSYSEQTAQMKKLLEELDVEENKEKIKKLGLNKIVKELKRVQLEFEELYTQQAEANAELRSLPSATTIRKDLEKSLRNYFQLLSAMNSLPDWSMIYADINELVKSATNS